MNDREWDAAETLTAADFRDLCHELRLYARQQIPEGSMRVGPGTDALVWRVCPDYKAEL